MLLQVLNADARIFLYENFLSPGAHHSHPAASEGTPIHLLYSKHVWYLELAACQCAHVAIPGS
jgi:hypothetical protein